MRIGQSAPGSSRHGFTMIEIALSLAIIGFAVVAILGVLPIGLGVQKDNREETIVDQDAVVWMNSIRSGSVGYDDLTNSVIAITNVAQAYSPNWTPLGNPDTNVYLPNGSFQNGSPSFKSYALTNGLRIIGLLTKPKFESTPNLGYLPYPIPGQPFVSNYTVAIVRAMSGSAVEKVPQDNPDILAGAFTYRMIVEMTPYVPVNPESVDFSFINSLTRQQLIDRTNYANMVTNLQYNSHNLRLTFRWPILPTGDVGNGRVSFRSLVGGNLVQTNDPQNNSITNLYFLQPSIYSASAHGP